MAINSNRRAHYWPWCTRGTFAVLVALTSTVVYGEIYQQPIDFLRRIFHGEPPPAQLMTLDDTLAPRVTQVLGHRPTVQRMRYWQRNGVSAWILDEVGKTEPITFGVTVENGQIRQIEVLAFRESRGWEIRHDFFIRQFNGAALDPNLQLDRPIDGITGATLSVDAMRRVATLALVLAAAIPH